MDTQGEASRKGEFDQIAARWGHGRSRKFELDEGDGIRGVVLAGFSTPSQEGLIAKAVLPAEAGGGGWVLIELREPMLTLGLGVVTSVGHAGHHATD